MNMKYNMLVDQCSLRLTNTLINFIVSDIYVFHIYFDIIVLWFSWCRHIFSNDTWYTYLYVKNRYMYQYYCNCQTRSDYTCT